MWAWTFNDSREGCCVPVARVQYGLKRRLNTLHLVSGILFEIYHKKRSGKFGMSSMELHM